MSVPCQLRISVLRATEAGGLELRCRTEEAITVVEDAVAARGVPAASLTLGTDNGSALTSRRFPSHQLDQDQEAGHAPYGRCDASRFAALLGKVSLLRISRIHALNPGNRSVIIWRELNPDYELTILGFCLGPCPDFTDALRAVDAI